jgi:glyoxylase-like metal-dependent hydrolase (beta-lactamase superfamily II)
LAHDGGLAALSFPHADPPAPGTTVEVAPGVRWLRMPLPFRLDHINLWLIEDGAGVAIVDTGLSNDSTRATWERLFAEELDGKPVTRVIVTHFHPDHMGNAGWLCRRWEVPLWCTEGEWLWGRSLGLDQNDAEFAEEQKPFYRRAGLDEDTVQSLVRGNPYWRRVTPVPRSFRRLSESIGVTIGAHQWRVVVGRGHAPQHATLWCRDLGVFIAGDQVLPKITPNVGVWPTEPESDPLSLYLDSLEKIRATVPDDVLVLPSHNLPFRGLHERTGQLIAHHEERLSALVDAADVPKSAAELIRVLFRRDLDFHQLGFALGETMAHLHRLVRTGRLARLERGGVYRFVRTDA